MKSNFQKKALIPALAMVLASLIALSGVSYAWFSMGNTAQISGIDVSVNSASGMLMSLNLTEWKSNFTKDDLSKAMYDIEGTEPSTAQSATYFPTKVDPISTIGVVQNGKINFFKIDEVTNNVINEISAIPPETSNGTINITGNFVAFDVFLDVGSEQGLYLGRNSTVQASASGKETHLAVRVAFVFEGTGSTKFDAANVNKGDKAIIWEPNSTTRTTYNTNLGLGGTGLQPYYGLKGAGNEIDLTKPATYEDQLEVVTVKTLEANPSQDLYLFDINAGFNKVRIYIWLEGQDVDCTNAISAGDFVVNLNFVKGLVENGNNTSQAEPEPTTPTGGN